MKFLFWLYRKIKCNLPEQDQIKQGDSRSARKPSSNQERMQKFVEGGKNDVLKISRYNRGKDPLFGDQYSQCCIRVLVCCRY